MGRVGSADEEPADLIGNDKGLRRTRSQATVHPNGTLLERSRAS